MPHGCCRRHPSEQSQTESRRCAGVLYSQRLTLLSVMHYTTCQQPATRTGSTTTNNQVLRYLSNHLWEGVCERFLKYEIITISTARPTREGLSKLMQTGCMAGPFRRLMHQHLRCFTLGSA
eukprot:155396-Chlamydomonas_euryale.AAC.12